MPKPPLVAIALILTTGLIGMAAFMAVAMRGMMGSGHMGMMGGDGSDPSRETPALGVAEVRVEGFAFAPASIVVDVGTTVTWTNHDSAAHTVTSDEGAVLRSPSFGRDETFSYTFDAPGEYWYHCEPHPNMKGLVRVREGPPG